MFPLVWLAGLGFGAPPAAIDFTVKPTRPNLVLILADDLGWADLGCQGADLMLTPRLDRIASNGLRFSHAYAMPVCSPSRAAIMTGKNPARIPMTIWSEGSRQGPKNEKLLEAESRHDLPHREKTIASWLKESGYLTALVGKWHLGDADHSPETHGFDINIGGTHWGQPRSFWWPYRGREKPEGEFRYVPHLEFGKPGEYLTDRLTDEAIRVIDRSREIDPNRPFFLFLAHHAPHKPIEAKPGDIALFEKRLRPGMRQQNTTYAAMVKNLDDNVGRLWDHLDSRGLLNDTLVIFASDNGGYTGTDHRQKAPVPITSNAPLRGGKGTLYEGGIRVPLLVAPPGYRGPGKVIDDPVILMDLFATLFESGLGRSATGGDGESLSPYWTQGKSIRRSREGLFFHYPHYYETMTPASALIDYPWKWIRRHEDGQEELYHLETDPSERTNLIGREKDQATRLAAACLRWQKETRAKLPRVNPQASPR